MREGNGSRRQGVVLDNGGGVEHGYGAESNGGTAGGKLWQWHIEGWRRGDGYEYSSIDARQNSVDGRVVALGPGGTAIERSRRRRDGNLIVIPLMYWPL